MKALFKKAMRYWPAISIALTIISSIITGGWYLKGEIDRSAETLIEAKVTVKENTKALQLLHDQVLILQEDERLREAQEDR